ncbi:hypothetical protein GCM10020331_041810 [Ectobacillus funiculus]
MLAFLWGVLILCEHEKNSVIYKYLIDVINIQYYNQRYIDFYERREYMKTSVIGATGYGGVELLRLLAHHPELEVASIHSFFANGGTD